MLKMMRVSVPTVVRFHPHRPYDPADLRGHVTYDPSTDTVELERNLAVQLKGQAMAASIREASEAMRRFGEAAQKAATVLPRR